MKCDEFDNCQLRVLDPEVAGCWDKICNKADKNEYHIFCHDCGRYISKDLWIKKDDKRKAHGLCKECISLYDSPHDY